MTSDALRDDVLATWRRHNEILLYLVEQVPDDGFGAKPTGSRGRDVARQLEHLDRVRLAWLHHHETGERLKLPRQSDGPTPTRQELLAALGETGQSIERWLGAALDGQVKPRLFGKNPIRWMGYLISHESHHRGQIMLALKQNGMRQPEKVAIQGLWGRWIFGKD